MTFTDRWLSLPARARRVIIFCGAGLLLGLIIFALYELHTSVKGSAVEQARKQERATWKGERDALVTHAEELERQKADVEAERKKLELAFNAADARTRAAQEQARQQLEAEDARYKEDAALAGQDVDARERCHRLCERAKRLRLIDQAADCGCDGQ